MNGLFGMIDPTNSSRSVQSQEEIDFLIAEKAYARGDFASAVSYLRKSANAGYAPAQNNLGLAYEAGEGVHVDMNEAFKWYLKSANQDYAEALNNLGCIYLDKQQYSNAFSNFHRAAEKGYALAQLSIGTMYINGISVKESRSEGIMWLKKSAAQGNADAVSVLRDLNVY